MSFIKYSRLVFTLLALGLIAWGIAVWCDLAYYPLLKQPSPLLITMPPGTGIRYLSHQLQDAHLLRYPRVFIFLARIRGDAPRLKAGEYLITPSMTAMDLLSIIATGKVMQHAIVFIEGWTFAQCKAALQDNGHLTHTLDNQNDVEIMSQLGHPGQSPEGLFFPDTYFFSREDTDISILKRAYQRMQEVLLQQWTKRETGLPYDTPYQALIVASLIEKETALAEERPLIAGVIRRRLEKGMLLQVDPSVWYGLRRDYRGPLTKGDLMVDTPYNTYQHHGLPPTPISMPSRAAIVAALHPTAGEALYYVSRGDGSHQFSVHYADHQRAVILYKRTHSEEPFYFLHWILGFSRNVDRPYF
ncbi:MAG: hypothetical protein A3F41_00640 [Coxiella sp. RIFCSPHIGHO2_12_FULL_44_14]|nr:MAG: hypothetical protein A3F41_00640 [Coxiella sp. RIFCSPHIGHO2_12_FULL_44_14]